MSRLTPNPRRRFLRAAGALVASFALPALAQSPLRYADMHSHFGMSLMRGFSYAESLAAEMRAAGLQLVAWKVVADYPQLRITGGRLRVLEGGPERQYRQYFDGQFGAILARAQREGLVVVDSAAALERALKEARPAVALAAEGADFLENDLAYLDACRAAGLVHLQIVHYRVSEVGDISTEAPVHGGLTAYGKDLVRACNRLGILVDVAHCSTDGVAQALEISTKPVIYSHGWVVQQAPAWDSRNARGIHVEQAKRIAAAGGVVGAFPIFGSNQAYAEYLLRMVGMLGALHVGIGTDLGGLPRASLTEYGQLREVAEGLAKGGLKDEEVGAVMGGNYVRVLGQTLRGQ